jgi:DNA-binding CsgD family transcriptional regulator
MFAMNHRGERRSGMRTREIDWEAVRRHYDQGHSMRECKAKFGFSNYGWDRAVIESLIIPRENPRKRWKHETRKAVKRLLDRGLTHAEIAFELGVSKPTVSYHVRKLGIPRDSRAARRYDWGEIQAAHDSGLSMRECCAQFGCSPSAWYHAVKSGKLRARSREIPIEDLLTKGRRSNRGHLKARLLKAGLKEERCEACGLTEWRGKPLRITLHHNNGDGYDNRLENLSFLCPNCHSQTSNFGGRNGHLRARPEA